MTATAVITVVPSTNVAPVLHAIPDLTSTEGASVSILAIFEDPDAPTCTPRPSTGETGRRCRPARFRKRMAQWPAPTCIPTTARSPSSSPCGTTATVPASMRPRWSVGNVLPVANARGPYSGVAGLPIQFSGTAIDPGADTLVYEWDFDYNGSTFDVDAVGAAQQRTYAAGGSFVVALRVRDDDGVSAVVTSAVTVATKPPVVLYFALESSATLSGVSMANEDIVAYDGAAYSLFFDGSDVGLSSAVIDAFAVVGPTRFCCRSPSRDRLPAYRVPWTTPISCASRPRRSGAPRPDRLRCTSTPATSGSATSDEDVDAIEVLPNGQLVMSTLGSFSVTGASGAGHDLIVFTPTSLGVDDRGDVGDVLRRQRRRVVEQQRNRRRGRDRCGRPHLSLHQRIVLGDRAVRGRRRRVRVHADPTGIDDRGHIFTVAGLRREPSRGFGRSRGNRPAINPPGPRGLYTLRVCFPEPCCRVAQFPGRTSPASPKPGVPQCWS